MRNRTAVAAAVLAALLLTAGPAGAHHKPWHTRGPTTSTSTSTTSTSSTTSTTTTSTSTTTTSTTTTTAPSATSKPGPGNTGPLTSDLAPMTAAQVETSMAGGRTLFERVAITGMVRVQAPAQVVTFRNFTIDARGASYGLQNCYGVTSCSQRVVLEDGAVFNTSSAPLLARTSTSFRATRLDLYDSDGDAVKVLGSNIVVERSWFHDLGRGVDAHADGIQSQTAAANVVVRSNNCDMPVREWTPEDPYNSNACWLGPAANVRIEGNWLNGGNYTIYCGPGIHLVNNRFGRDYRFGPIAGVCSTNSGNVWDDTGAPL